MRVERCCFFVPLRTATFAIFALDLLYGLVFGIVSIARNSDFAITLGSPGVVWLEVILHFGYAAWSGFAMFLAYQASTTWLVRIPKLYRIACIAMGLLQFILLVIGGVFRSATIAHCQEENGWPQDACSSAMTLAYALLGVGFVAWTIAHVYFWFVVQGFSLRTEGRLRYMNLKDQYLSDWDNRLDASGGQLPRTGSVRSAFSAV
ncbi:hypothetical protein BC940DRAFT_292354 [Gongronella butleri]|nr:hypothetical protein BC940DRAFT_292354 [Gongronella butleri]